MGWGERVGGRNMGWWICLGVNRSIQVSVVCDLELEFVYMYCLNYIYSERKKSFFIGNILIHTNKPVMFCVY